MCRPVRLLPYLALLGCAQDSSPGSDDPNLPIAMGDLVPAGGARISGGAAIASMPSLADEPLGHRGLLRFDDLLDTQIISTNGLRLDVLKPGGLRSEEDLAELVRYSVKCMLASDQRLDVAYRAADGSPRNDTYEGNLGLEPSWGEEPLSETGRLWWLACLGAHATALDTPETVAFAPRSETHPALAGQAPAGYDYQQAGFWAVASGIDDPPFHLYSCEGSFRQNNAEVGRFCANAEASVLCGDAIRYVGVCEERTGALVPYACESQSRTQDGLHVDRCHDASSFGDWADPSSSHVITAYLP
jgi:hypothetical protein